MYSLCAAKHLAFSPTCESKATSLYGRIKVLHLFRLVKSSTFTNHPSTNHTSVRFGASGCHVCAARVKHKSQQVSKDKRGNSGLNVNLASQNTFKNVPKRDARTRIMFSNDLFRIGNISTLPSASLTQSMGNQGLERSS